MSCPQFGGQHSVGYSGAGYSGAGWPSALMSSDYPGASRAAMPSSTQSRLLVVFAPLAVHLYRRKALG